MDPSDSFLRLANAIHFVIYFANLNNLKQLNATLLLKIIFFAEVACLDTLGELLTGVKMVKAKFGPAPNQRKEAINYLVLNKKISVNNSSLGIKYTNLLEPNFSSFSKEKLNILEYVTGFICVNYTAKMVSDNTHKNKFWLMVNMGDEIPITAFLNNKFEKLTTEEFEFFKKESEKYEVPEEFQVDCHN
jgi:hypothetical protein